MGIAGLSVAGAAQAEVPQVVTDIRPVHSIVAAVMGELGTPALLLEGNEDPHSFSLRPSQVRALSQAGLVVWMGEGMTPWLEGGMDIAKDAVSLELLELEDLPLVIEAGEDDPHDHGAEEDHAEHKDEHGHDDEHGEDHAEHKDEHGHDDEHGEDHAEHKDEHGHDDEHGEDHAEHKDEHGHDDEHGEDHAEHKDEHGHDDEHGEDHAEHKDEHGHDDEHGEHKDGDDHGHDDHAHHDHGALDPHAWLDPLNAARYAAEIAETLSKIDPGNAATYTANAEAAAARYTALAEDIASKIGADYDATVLVYHDAYRYFFTRFKIPLAATITDLHGIAPSAATIAELRDAYGDSGAVCLLTEGTADPRVIQTVLPEAKTFLADQLGRSFDTGPDLYEALIQNTADTILACKG